MDKDEQRARMERMRETIREHNVYLWAANLVSALARLRPAQENANDRVDGSAPQ
jgi:trehalose 6-phosphate synthase